MRIRTKQTVSVVFVAVLMVILGLIVWQAALEEKKILANYEFNSRYGEVLAQMRFFAVDLQNNPGIRAEAQWKAGLVKMAGLILEQSERGLFDERTRERRSEKYAMFVKLFERWREVNLGVVSNESSYGIQQRLMTQLIAHSTEMVGDNYSISRQLLLELVSVSRRMDLLGALMLMAILIISMGNWLLVRLSVLQPLAQLQDDMALVASGNLDAESQVIRDDEIGDLSRGFHYMVLRLREARKSLESELRIRAERERELERTRERLESSNAELEQFAYVASHDLQEPLRMVASYMGLLQSRYKDKLDQEAQEFIGYAVDGAQRLRLLIQDILAYSRVKNVQGRITEVSAAAVFDEVTRNLAQRLAETGAELTAGELPVIRMDPVQLLQLLQNLIGNAVKFVGEDKPRIHVSAERTDERGWTFSVKDNGIGIAPEYQERIFGIFQRLHTRREYSGTGIGLALCKRIVEKRGGHIRVRSALGAGAAMLFYIPDEINGDNDDGK